MSAVVDGYYLNGLRSWKSRLQVEHRRLMARYASLERQGHPSTRGQGKLIELNSAMIELVDAALSEPRNESAAGSADGRVEEEHGGRLCSDCPPAGYPTNKTRCQECPRRPVDGNADMARQAIQSMTPASVARPLRER